VPEPTTHRFRAMGSDCEVTLVGSDEAGLLAGAQQLVEDLEQRWSRFRPDSTLCSLNAGAGTDVVVDRETADLVGLALEAWAATGGRFDPTVLDALEAIGYRRSFEQAPVVPGVAAAAPAPGMGGVRIDPVAASVRLPVGVRLDLGGIGKGRAADLVVAHLVERAVAGVCVDLGGDVRLAGVPPHGAGAWAVAVDDPLDPGEDLAVVHLLDGAVTTSSRLRRRWPTAAGEEAHHLVDPGTGRPAASGLVSVTVVSAGAAWGEVHAKAALVAGPDAGAGLLDGAGLAGLLVTDDGEVLRAGGIDHFCESTVLDRAGGRREQAR